mmetsp:Transcript_72959/g.126541  ORF Transcript_72959/g.126541 Transcript_72959/m.126541 type:complete len:220 (-) Transcript_72959:96-755(-)
MLKVKPKVFKHVCMSRSLMLRKQRVCGVMIITRTQSPDIYNSPVFLLKQPRHCAIFMDPGSCISPFPFRSESPGFSRIHVIPSTSGPHGDVGVRIIATHGVHLVLQGLALSHKTDGGARLFVREIDIHLLKQRCALQSCNAICSVGAFNIKIVRFKLRLLVFGVVAVLRGLPKAELFRLEQGLLFRGLLSSTPCDCGARLLEGSHHAAARQAGEHQACK